MTQVRSYCVVTVFVTIILCVMQTNLFAQGHNVFDMEIPSQKDVEASLEIAKRISVLDQLTAMDMLQLYKAEKKAAKESNVQKEEKVPAEAPK